MYYRTDAGVYVPLSGNIAGRVAAYAQATAPQNIATTAYTDIVGLSVTFNADPTHYYRTTVFFLASSTVVSDDITGDLVDASNNRKQLFPSPYLDPQSSMTMYAALVETGLSGSITRKARANRGGTGTMTIAGDPTFPRFILVEDLGAMADVGGGGGVTDHGALTGLADNDHPQYAAGGLFKPGFWFAHPGGVASGAPTGGAGYTMPWFFPNGLVLAQVGVNVSTLQAGSTMRVALYADDGTGYPGALIADLGTIDTSVAGARTLDFADLTLAPGLYWVTTVSLTSGSIASVTNCNAAPPWPVPVAAGVVNSAVVALLTVAHPTAPFTTFPSSFSTTNLAPRVMLKTA